MANTSLHLLGPRWSGARPPRERLPVREALQHYAGHRSFFHLPPMAEAQGGELADAATLGVLAVDPTDPSAVREAMTEPGRWLLLAVLPDFIHAHADPEARLKAEALCYGGLRDLELACVANPAARPALLLFDQPGRMPGQDEVELLAQGAASLVEEWLEEGPSSSVWPSRCHMVALEKEGRVPDLAPAWERVRASEQGTDMPDGARHALAGGRLLAPAQAKCWHAEDKVWLALGRAQPLSDFRVARITFQSAAVFLGACEVAWPEPGAPELDGRGAFLRQLAPLSQVGTQDFNAWLGALAEPTHDMPASLDALPNYQRAWLAFRAGGRA